MEESEFLTPGISMRLKRAKELERWDVLAVTHCVVPLFFFSVVKKNSPWKNEVVFRMQVVTPDLQTTIGVKTYEKHEIDTLLSEKVSTDVFLDKIWQEPIANNYFAKNNFSRENLHITGYLDRRQFYRDYFIFFDEIPQL